MTSLTSPEFPFIIVDALHKPETINELLQVQNIAIDGLACAIKLGNEQSPQHDPLLTIEDAIALRLGCTLDSEGLPQRAIEIRSTFGRIETKHNASTNTKPQLLISVFSGLEAGNPQESKVFAQHLIPLKNPGRTDKCVLGSVTYSTKTNKSGAVQLTKNSVAPRISTNPYSYVNPDHVPGSVPSDRGIMLNRLASGRLGTI